MLHYGRIAEMATGEGKTLVATMPVYLNALTGRGVHLVTVNDYLAARDCEWMGALFRFLGLTVGCIQHDQSPDVRRAQYTCDITYGTNAEFGFDYLRDNGMAQRKEEQVQRGHYYAIVDEVDSILIDEARTPLIISGPATVTFDEQYATIQAAGRVNWYRAQERLCNRLISEAEETSPSCIRRTAQRRRRGRAGGRWACCSIASSSASRKSPGLLKLMEDPENLRRMDHAELQLPRRPEEDRTLRPKGGTALRDRRKKPRGRSDRKGPQLPEPERSGRVRAAGPGRRCTRSTTARSRTPRKRIEEKTKLQQDSRQSPAHPRHLPAAAGLLPLRERRGIRHREQGRHRGRVHRASHDRPPLERRAAPGGRGEGRGRDRARDPDAGDHHHPELFPALPKAGGHDRHRGDRGHEFHDIYKLDVMVIPTNRPVARKDANDSVYKTRREKYNAVDQGD